jgi:tRNA (guanine-N7-)-methyltransferase
MINIFNRDAETIVEIGFGMGASLLTMAKMRPDVNFIGIEVHRAGIGSLATALFDEKVANVRIAPIDACEVFKQSILDESLAGIQIFFPDPWPKKRHHKRRLVQLNFVNLLVKKLRKGGFLHCATDWEDYAHHMNDVLSNQPVLRNQHESGGFVERPNTRPLTKFESRGIDLGHEVFDLIFLKCN